MIESKNAATVVLMLNSPEEEILAKACEAIYKFALKGMDFFFSLSFFFINFFCQNRHIMDCFLSDLVFHTIRLFNAILKVIYPPKCLT